MFPKQLLSFLDSTVIICGKQQKPHQISAVLPWILQQPINIPEGRLRRVSLSAVLLPASTCQPRSSGVRTPTLSGGEKRRNRREDNKILLQRGSELPLIRTSPQRNALRLTCTDDTEEEADPLCSVNRTHYSRKPDERHKGWSSLLFRGNTDRVFLQSVSSVRRTAGVRLYELQLHQAFSANGVTFTGKDTAINPE